MKSSNYKPIKDERDEQIETASKSLALEFVTTAAQIVTIMCLIKRNPAWKGCFSIVFFGIAASLLYKYAAYREKPYLWVGMVLGLLGLALLIWFGITG